MKRLLLLVAALLMAVGVAYGQTCIFLEPSDAGVGEDIELTLMLDGSMSPVVHWNWGAGMETWGDPEAEPPIVEDAIIAVTQVQLDSDGGHLEHGVWEQVQFDEEGFDPTYGTFAEALAAGGVGTPDCDFGGAPPGDCSAVVLLDFEGADTYTEVWDWSGVLDDDFETDYVSDAPEGSDTAATWVASTGEDNGSEMVRWWETPNDLSAYSYFNFYCKFSADPTAESGVWIGVEGDDGGCGIWVEDITSLPNFTVGEWFYVSYSFETLLEDTWDTWPTDFSEHTVLVFWFEQWVGDGFDVSIDYVTASNTADCGMIGAVGPPPVPASPVQVTGPYKAEEGDDVTFGIALDGIEAVSQQWKKDGEDLEGETGTELALVGVTIDDSGEYMVVIDDGEEALVEIESDPHVLLIFPVGAVPLAGGLGLGLLAGACALAGAVTIRRKK